MSNREQWIQGLQWGACAWLGWVAWRSALWAAQIYNWSTFPSALLVAAAWIAALALTWTRRARAGIAAALVIQAVKGTLDAASYPGPLYPSFALTFWLPMSLPLIPLLFMEPTRPRYTLALAMVGRWRDALAQLAGWRWIAVAAAIISLNHIGWYFMYWTQGQGWGAALLHALETPALLLALAALPRLSILRSAWRMVRSAA